VLRSINTKISVGALFNQAVNNIYLIVDYFKNRLNPKLDGAFAKIFCEENCCNCRNGVPAISVAHRDARGAPNT
jgi:hypothetical protein